LRRVAVSGRIVIAGGKTTRDEQPAGRCDSLRRDDHPEEGMMTATGADVTRVTEDYLALIWKACEWPDDGRRPNTTALAAAAGAWAVRVHEVPANRAAVRTASLWKEHQ